MRGLSGSAAGAVLGGDSGRGEQDEEEHHVALPVDGPAEVGLGDGVGEHESAGADRCEPGVAPAQSTAGEGERDEGRDGHDGRGEHQGDADEDGGGQPVHEVVEVEDVIAPGSCCLGGDGAMIGEMVASAGHVSTLGGVALRGR